MVFLELRGINILSIVVGLYLLYRTVQMIRSKIDDIPQLVGWGIAGVGLIITGLFPNVSGVILSILGMEVPAFALFSVSILFLITVIIHMFSRIRRLEVQISKLNSSIAISNYEDELNNDDNDPAD